MNKMSAFGIVVLVIGFGLIFSAMILGVLASLEGTTIEKGDCYDRFRNKINGVTCDVEVIKGLDVIVSLGVLGMFLTFISIFPIIHGQDSQSTTKEKQNE